MNHQLHSNEEPKMTEKEKNKFKREAANHSWQQPQRAVMIYQKYVWLYILIQQKYNQLENLFPSVIIHQAEETSINLRSKIRFRRPSAIIHVDPANLLADQTFIESSQIMKADYHQIIFLNLIYIHMYPAHVVQIEKTWNVTF